MVKICRTGLLKLNFEIVPKKRIFRFLPKISAGHGWSWKIFFANFQTLGPLGCQGWVVIPQNVKKSQNHCTLIYTYVQCTYIEYRAVSGVFRTIDPHPLSTQRVCPPPAPEAGGVGYTHAGRWGGGGSIFRKMPDIGLASYSIIPLRFWLSKFCNFSCYHIIER